MKKHIVCVTGCRSEYDICYPVLKKMHNDESFRVSVIAAGAHLSERFGYTVKDIEADGFTIADRICTLIDSDREIGKIKGAGMLLLGLSDSLSRLNPDFVMVVGDREESIVAGLVCTYLGIPLMHLCGGDRTAPKAGDVDEPIRHATSKLAHLHFTMNEAHTERLLKMGEEPWRVFTVGDPALDRFAEIPKMSRDEVVSFFGFEDLRAKKPLIMVLQHVISGEVDAGARQLRETIEAVTSLDALCVINYPNTDMGSRDMIREIESSRSLPYVRVTRNIPRIPFVNLLRNIDVLVGNSSMALLEGSFLKIPAINVGERNKDRMNGGNVVFVEPERKKIRTALEKIISDEKYYKTLKKCTSVYGDGKASLKIIRSLKKLNKSRPIILAKNITY